MTSPTNEVRVLFIRSQLAKRQRLCVSMAGYLLEAGWHACDAVAPLAHGTFRAQEFS
jgi:hypothetical protein